MSEIHVSREGAKGYRGSGRDCGRWTTDRRAEVGAPLRRTASSKSSTSTPTSRLRAFACTNRKRNEDIRSEVITPEIPNSCFGDILPI